MAEQCQVKSNQMPANRSQLEIISRASNKKNARPAIAKAATTAAAANPKKEQIHKHTHWKRAIY